MSQDLKLDRAILETKERAELHAIADALKIKTSSRAKKSDIIDTILESAVGVDDQAEKSKLNGVDPVRSNGKSAGIADGNETYLDEKVLQPVNNANSDQLGSDSVSSEFSGKIKTPRVNISLVKMANDDGSLASASNEKTFERLDSIGDVDNDHLNNFTRPIEVIENGQKDAVKSDSVSSEQSDVSDTSVKQNGSVVKTTPQETNLETATGDNGSKQAKSNETSNSAKRNRRRRGGSNKGDKVRTEQTEQPYDGEPIFVEGLLDLKDEGYGFLRTVGYLPSNKDVYVSLSQVRKFALRRGDWIVGASRPPASNEKYPALLKIDTVNYIGVEESRLRPKFEDLTPLFPDSKLNLELALDPSNLTARIVDLLSPIGKGQRGLIVSPPKAGKTTIMKQIARSIEANNPDVKLMVLLVDERPEEVTDMRRTVKGDVIASTFDRPHEEHTTVAELTIERAKRLVELGQDVVIILDGITRLARAYNLAQPASGKVMSGGVDSGALYPPKKFFGAARNTEEGGSLTILATALVETGSKMDEVIFEEFKGTGNMELRLDRRLAERRIYPAIDVNASSTRHEELLFDRIQLQQVWKLRRALNMLASEGNNAPGLELLMDRLKKTHNNDEFLSEIAKSPSI